MSRHIGDHSIEEEYESESSEAAVGEDSDMSFQTTMISLAVVLMDLLRS